MADELGKLPFDSERKNNLSAFDSWAGGSSGLVNLAVVFTDIIESTKLTHQHGIKDWEPILVAHFGQANDLIKKHHGFFVKTIGDAVMATFKNSVDALNFAHELEFNPGHPVI